MSLKSTQELKPRHKVGKGFEYSAKKELVVSASDHGTVFFEGDTDDRLVREPPLSAGVARPPFPLLADDKRLAFQDLENQLDRIESRIAGLKAEIVEYELQESSTIVDETIVKLVGKIAEGYNKLEHREKERSRIRDQMEALKESYGDELLPPEDL